MAPDRAIRGAWLLALALVFAPRAGAVDIAWNDSGLEPVERARAHAVVDDVASRLPPRWREALGRRIGLEWRDDLPPDVHGRALRDRILLRRDLLRSPDVGHAIDPAAAALVHELAHLLDRSHAGGLSREPRLLDLAGWQDAVLRGRMVRSTFRDRSPDPYELTHPREFVAVNLEHFLLDPSYACRRPALARYFATRLGAPPDSVPCAPTHAFIQADPAADAGSSPLLEIDPARVAGVDVLLAEPAAAPMSRWGHVMLRLVVCAPHRAPGPDCRLDLAHHRVLSFRAFVDDVQISSWRGLTGSYPSRLFVLPLSQVVDEYTKVELRGLRSVPLRLNRADVAGLLEHAAQLHWSYDGRYWFVTNNCAVETWRLLRDGVPRLGVARQASITPTGLFARLEREGIADATALADRDAATASGHYFPSQATHYASLFEVARAALPLPARDVHAWLDLSPQERSPWIGRTDLQSAAAMLVLENAALRREEAHARDALRRRWVRNDGVHDAAYDALRLADRLTRPAALLPTGYGLPQRAERATLRDAAASLSSRWREADSRLQREARAALPPSRRAGLEATEANIAMLGARLRGLHRATGGLDLGEPPR